MDTEPGRRSVEPSAEWSTIDAAVRLAQFLPNHAPDAISWIGPDARFVYVNKTFCCSLQDHLNILTRSSQDQRAPSLPNRTEPGDWSRQGGIAMSTPQERTVQAGDYPVRVFEAGRGEPLLFLHSAGGGRPLD